MRIWFSRSDLSMWASLSCDLRNIYNVQNSKNSALFKPICLHCLVTVVNHLEIEFNSLGAEILPKVFGKADHRSP